MCTTFLLTPSPQTLLSSQSSVLAVISSFVVHSPYYFHLVSLWTFLPDRVQLRSSLSFCFYNTAHAFSFVESPRFLSLYLVLPLVITADMLSQSVEIPDRTTF